MFNFITVFNANLSPVLQKTTEISDERTSIVETTSDPPNLFQNPHDSLIDASILGALNVNENSKNIDTPSTQITQEDQSKKRGKYHIKPFF